MLDKRGFKYAPPRENLDSSVETRIEILRKEAKGNRLDVPDEVITYLAHRLDLDVQQLKNALVRIMAYSSINNRDMNLQLAVDALGDRKSRIRRRRKSNPSRMPLLSRASITVMLSIILLLNGCGGTKESTAPAPVVSKKVENTAKAAETNVQQDLSFRGQTEPYQVVFLSPSISGNVKEMNVDLGAYVKKDQVLAKIDESDLAYQIKQAEANVKKVEVEAQMRAIEQQISLNEIKATLAQDPSADIAVQKLGIRDAEKAVAEAQKNLEKVTFLFEHGGVPQEQLDQARAQKLEAEEQVKAAKENVAVYEAKANSQKKSSSEVAKLQKSSIQASNRLTKMGVEQAKADLDLIRYKYNNLTVKAPINGFITDVRVMMGQATTPADTMFVITNQDKLYVRGDVPEALINKIKVGQQATITIPTIGKSVKGEVIFVAPLADPKTQAFPIRILIDNANHEIKGGMRTQVSIKSE